MPEKKALILIADDDAEIRGVLRLMLEQEGYETLEAADGAAAVAATLLHRPDLILLDVMMPGCSGLEACRRLRAHTLAPVLFLTARGQEADKEQGFAAGGDDYLVKPFSRSELLARTGALLRRWTTYGSRQAAPPANLLRVRRLALRTDYNEVYLDEKPLSLTDLEYRILRLLARHRGQIFSLQAIYEQVWNEPYLYSSGNTVMVHIRNLRRKLEPTAQSAKYIQNVWGKGYRLE